MVQPRGPRWSGLSTIYQRELSTAPKDNDSRPDCRGAKAGSGVEAKRTVSKDRPKRDTMSLEEAVPLKTRPGLFQPCEDWGGEDLNRRRVRRTPWGLALACRETGPWVIPSTRWSESVIQ